MKKKYILNLAVVFILLTGCAPQANKEIAEERYGDGFVFAYGDMAIYLGEYAERILARLEPMDSHEYKSCSFDGMAKIYYYGDFEISTYVSGGSDKDRIYSIELFTVPTPEGAYIGNTFGDMVSIYGTGYEELQASSRLCFYRYAKSGTILSFGIEDGKISSILYQVENMYEE